MDPLTNRLVARYAARTIQFDSRMVSKMGWDLGVAAVEKLLRALPGAFPVGKSLGAGETIVSDRLQLRNVLGKTLTVTVRVGHRKHSRGQRGGPTAGGHLNSDSGVVTLFINTEWPPELLDSAKTEVGQTFSTNLVHEVTHALDVLSTDDYVGAKGDPEVYFNQPNEFRAYAKQIVTEALSKIPMLKRTTYRGKPLPPLSKLVEELLAKSKVYEMVKDHFNSRNHKRLRQILVREIQDSGLIPDA